MKGGALGTVKITKGPHAGLEGSVREMYPLRSVDVAEGRRTAGPYTSELVVEILGPYIYTFVYPTAPEVEWVEELAPHGDDR